MNGRHRPDYSGSKRGSGIKIIQDGMDLEQSIGGGLSQIGSTGGQPMGTKITALCLDSVPAAAFEPRYRTAGESAWVSSYGLVTRLSSPHHAPHRTNEVGQALAAHKVSLVTRPDEFFGET